MRDSRRTQAGQDCVQPGANPPHQHKTNHQMPERAKQRTEMQVESNVVVAVGASGQERAFAFDVVLGPESSQHAMFQECGMTRLIDMVFLEGSHDSLLAGLMQRSLSYLLELVGQSEEGFHLCASYLEIYNEQVCIARMVDTHTNTHTRVTHTRVTHTHNSNCVFKIHLCVSI
ncbi:unnamed protein product [Coregonus sp. 'balchen']|nr:unnamed protein product [Coregonus sp. 'balchen']